MPYKFELEKIKLPRDKDRRVKLNDDDKEYIKKLHREGNAIREIARIFEGRCSRRAIQYILFPERLAKVHEQFKERRLDGRYYPGKDKWKLVMREHRAYKHKVIKGLSTDGIRNNAV